MPRIQTIAIIVSLLFLGYVIKLILKGKLRVEYSIFWIVTTAVLSIFSFWRDGFEKIAEFVGVYEAPNLIFTIAIFAIFVYLIHLSKVVSKLHEQNKTLIQELTLLSEKIKNEKVDKSN